LSKRKADSSVKQAVAGYMAELSLDGAGKPLAAIAVVLAKSLEAAPEYARGRLARELRELLTDLDDRWLGRTSWRNDGPSGGPRLSGNGRGRPMPKKLTPAQHYGLYGAQHRSLRKRLAPLVEAGEYACAKCGKRIEPNTAWDLGHQAQGGRAPEHSACNRATVYKRARDRNGEFLPEKPQEPAFAFVPPGRRSRVW
jgi:hypothetical protein